LNISLLLGAAAAVVVVMLVEVAAGVLVDLGHLFQVNPLVVAVALNLFIPRLLEFLLR
jgi:hypothetical protein